MMLEDDSDRGNRRQKMGWYAVTAMAVVAIVLFNSDERIVGLDSTGGASPMIAVEDSGAVDRRSHNQPKPIEWIAILGERNSGTRWLYDHIGGCFNHTLGVKRYLTRYKHWFQYPNASKYPHDTLVLAQFRNPYDWLEAMRNVPHHSPEHLQLKWEEFIEKPWTMDRIGLDLLNDTDVLCQEDFEYNQLISCNVEPLPKSAYNSSKIRYSEHQPFYELRQDGSGEPFKNIMEMRSAKIRNFMTVRDYDGIADVWSIQYEYLLSKGTDHLLTKIEEWTGVKRQCTASPVQNRRKRPLSRTFAKYVNNHLDWSAEGLIGYTQETFV